MTLIPHSFIDSRSILPIAPVGLIDHEGASVSAGFSIFLPELSFDLEKVTVSRRRERQSNTAESSETTPDALARNWTKLSLSGLSDSAFRRISRFAHEESAWRGSRAKALTPDSLAGFLDFWEHVRESAREPEFALSPKGYLQAEWHNSWRKHLEVRFDSQSVVSFQQISGPFMLEGVCTQKELLETLRARKFAALK